MGIGAGTQVLSLLVGMSHKCHSSFLTPEEQEQ